MKKIFRLSCLAMTIAMLWLPTQSYSQSVGIGTTSPSDKAALDIKATDKGVLFPRLTTAQRNAIANPPDGLHIYNKDERCLNYYDSVYQVWNCYCETDTCKTVTIHITEDVTTLDFYSVYASKYPGIKKFVVLIKEDVTINGNGNTPAFSFATMPYAATIKVLNYGSIYGSAGNGGRGAAGQVGAPCSLTAQNGTNGGNAVATIPGVVIRIINYALVAGGGGGGRTTDGQYGGGGGGGAGLPFSFGGAGGGATAFNICIPSCVCGLSGGSIAGSGTTGTNVTPGTGGTGASGGGNGGNGGGLALAGQNGTGTAAGTAGTPGKAIAGGSGNSITNMGGVYYGVVD